MFTFETIDLKEVRRFSYRSVQRENRNRQVGWLDGDGSRAVGPGKQIQHSATMGHHDRSKRAQGQYRSVAAGTPCSRLRGRLLLSGRLPAGVTSSFTSSNTPSSNAKTLLPVIAALGG